MAKIWAYLRVSTDKQETEKNKSEINDFVARNGIGAVDYWVEEVVSGKKDIGGRRLGDTFSAMKKGDSLIVPELSRISRNSFEAISFFESMRKKGCVFYSCKESDLNIYGDWSESLMVMLRAAFAEQEANMISQRTRQALADRKARGIELGRKKGFRLAKTQDRLAEIEDRISKGQAPTQIMKEMGLNPGSYYNIVNNN